MKFYDTSSLLLKADNLFDEEFIISSITYNELERIKDSVNKEPDIRFIANKIWNLLDNNEDKFQLYIFTEDMLKNIKKYNFTITDDMRILASAIHYKNNKKDDNFQFISNDTLLRRFASLFFNQNEINKIEDKDFYSGYKIIQMNNDEMSHFYSNLNVNNYNIFINEYIIIKDETNKIVDTLRWTGEEFKTLQFGNFNSKWFGDIKPIKNDIYQAMVCDSFQNNTITMVKGPAGSGKSYLSIGYLIHLLERGKIDKIIIFCNTVAAKNAAKMGFYPGTRDEKLLDSQIGNFLISKLGSRFEVERMIDQEKIILLPMSDIRGYDTSGMNAGIYITEAQNLDIELMKLALQRIGNDSICIIDGDDKTQVDDVHFAGSNNGIKRVSKVFRGKDFYGEIELNKIHRSKIAQTAELM